MFNTLREDLAHKREVRGWPRTWRSFAHVCLSEGTMAQTLYRAMRFCQTHHLGLFAFFLYRWNAFVSHMIIGRGADFGPGLVILHSVGIVVNSQVRAGRNLVLEHGVTLGEAHGRSPILGDNIYIGAGAKIIGGIRIGSNVKIGANAVVTKDLPDGVTAVGVPARIIRTDQGPFRLDALEAMADAEEAPIPSSQESIPWSIP